jgi:hypothetical protein
MRITGRFERYSRKSWDSLREIIAFDSAFQGIEFVTSCEFHPGHGETMSAIQGQATERDSPR